MADHDTRKRNEIRRFVAGTAEKLALGAVGFGALRPVFDPSIDGALSVFLSSVLFGFVVYGLAVYILRGLEDDDE